ncbi:MAG: esterase-like activity of phytase family protein [Sphingobium sp.]|nr:esterase-like activity of phytase family protein [Sphingobium sp.]
MRKLLLLILFILIGAVGYHLFQMVKKPPRPVSGPMVIKAEPLVLDSSNPQRTRLGSLYFLGAWQLSGRDRSFGGLSSLVLLPNGRMQALSDGAVLYSFPYPGMDGMGQVKPLPTMRDRASRRWLPGSSDSESMVLDPETGQIWVGFELNQAICRYAPGAMRLEKCHIWPEMKDWVYTSSIESLARLPDGRFMAIAEGAYGTKEGRDVLLFSGDPADRRTKSPVKMRYMPPAGYDPTDAVAIGGGQLLVLNRRATLYDGFTAILTVVDINAMVPGKMLPSREVARFVPPVLADNFEALAYQKQADGQRILWVLSDDNHLIFQRTLLLKFALPDRL